MRAKKTITEIRRDQITAAALDQIATEGISSLSIAGVADRVGIVPSAVYRHFSSKDKVLDAVLDHLREQLLRNVEIVHRESTQPLVQLQLLMMRHVSLLQENRAIPHVVFSDGINASDLKRRTKVHGIMSQYLGKVQDIIKTGQQHGKIRNDIEPKTISVMFLGMILPTVLLRNVSGGRFNMIKHAENVWPAFERGIIANN